MCVCDFVSHTRVVTVDSNVIAWFLRLQEILVVGNITSGVINVFEKEEDFALHCHMLRVGMSNTHRKQKIEILSLFCPFLTVR